MNALFALFLAVIYSVWIWSLKQELARIQGEQEHEDSAEGAPVHPQRLAKEHVRASAPQHPPHRAYVESAKKRRSDGVPVWTIQ